MSGIQPCACAATRRNVILALPPSQIGNGSCTGAGHAVFPTARSRGDETFLVYEDERWSFADTMARVDALGAALADRGVAVGDRVAIAMRNFPEWVVAFAAITSIGAISVSMNAGSKTLRTAGRRKWKPSPRKSQEVLWRPSLRWSSLQSRDYDVRD